MNQTGNAILIGTGKGLVVFRRKPAGWGIDRVHFLGFPVAMVYVDERTNTWWAGIAHRHWGQKLHYSIDEGRNWTAAQTPVYPSDAVVKSGKPATLRKVWCMAHAGRDRPGELYLGAEPGGLFHSRDGGQTFQLVEALWDHPSRQHEWFGAGRDFPFIHSIVVDPQDSDHFYIAVSCAGVFETRNGGRTWDARNQGLKATYLPNPEVEIGHDPHLVLACRAQPKVMWQQNHCGVYRSTDAGLNWQDVSGPDGFPYYGFALGIDHDNPDRAWVIPAISDEMRVAHDLALCVCRTEDGGRTWRALRNGLPQEHCFDIVFRHSLAVHGEQLVFGTTTGNVFYSEDGGDHWKLLSGHLQRVDSAAWA